MKRLLLALAGVVFACAAMAQSVSRDIRLLPVTPLWFSNGSIAPVASWSAATDPFPSAILSHSRTSNATMFDSTGKLTYAPNNLLTYSNTFNNGAWLGLNSGASVTSASITTQLGAGTAPDGVNSAWTLSVAGGGISGVKQDVTLPSGASGIAVVYVRASASGPASNVRLTTNNGIAWSTGSSVSVALTSSWQQVVLTGPPVGGTYRLHIGNITVGGGADATCAGNVDIAFSAISAVTYETTPRAGDQVITTSSAYYGPRIDYDPNTLAVKGLLIEEARTNLFINSGSLSSTATYGVTKSTDGTLAPDGVTAMTKVTASATTSAHELYNAGPITVVSGTTYSASIFVEKGNYRYVYITYEVANGSNGVIAIFDLDNPSAATQTFSTGGGSLVTHGILNQGGGVYRIYVVGSVTGAGTSGYMIAGFAAAATGNPTTATEPSWTAAGTEYGYFFGAQLEAGSFATSYIPTAASSVTRAADVVQFTGAALTALQGASASGVVETGAINVGASNKVLVGYSGAFKSFAYATVPFPGVVGAYNGTTGFTAANSVDWTSTKRAAFGFGPGGRSVVADNGAVASDSNTVGSVTSVYIGYDQSSGYLNGYIRSLAIYNQRLPDATLKAKTVVGAPYAANDNGVRFAFANDNVPTFWRLAL